MWSKDSEWRQDSSGRRARVHTPDVSAVRLEATGIRLHRKLGLTLLSATSVSTSSGRFCCYWFLFPLWVVSSSLIDRPFSFSCPPFILQCAPSFRQVGYPRRASSFDHLRCCIHQTSPVDRSLSPCPAGGLYDRHPPVLIPLLRVGFKNIHVQSQRPQNLTASRSSLHSYLEPATHLDIVRL
jgi:hypothetical protein